MHERERHGLYQAKMNIKLPSPYLMKSPNSSGPSPSSVFAGGWGGGTCAGEGTYRGGGGILVDRMTASVAWIFSGAWKGTVSTPELVFWWGSMGTIVLGALFRLVHGVREE